MKFEDLKNRHSGKIISIVGSGKSADLLTNDDTPKILINHQCLRHDLTGDLYGVWTDKQEEHINNWWCKVDGSIKFVLPSWLTDKRFNEHLDITEMELTSDLNPDRDAISKSCQLHNFTGTASTAVHLAYYLGAGHVNLYGIDGTTRSDGDRCGAVVSLYKQPKASNPEAYKNIKKYIIKELDFLKLSFTDFFEKL